MKLFCPQCQDVYHPTRRANRELDGAYFGPTFPHLLMMVKPEAFAPKTFRVYIPRVYGFRVHSSGRNYPLLDRAQTPAATRVKTWNDEMKARAQNSKRRARLRAAAASMATSAAAAAATAATGGGGAEKGNKSGKNNGKAVAKA